MTPAERAQQMMRAKARKLVKLNDQISDQYHAQQNRRLAARAADPDEAYLQSLRPIRFVTYDGRIETGVAQPPMRAIIRAKV